MSMPRVSDELDLLHGYEAIAAFLGITKRQAEHIVATTGLPTFKLPGSRIVRASRSRVAAWMEEQERNGLRKGGG